MKISNHIFHAGVFAIAAILLPAAYPQSTSQQAAPAMPPEAYTATRYNRSDEIRVTGRIEHVETVDGKLFVWVVARSVFKEGYGVPPGTEANGAGNLWRVDGVDPGKIKAGDKAKLARGSEVEISGHNSTDTSCKPTCRINSRKLSFD